MDYYQLAQHIKQCNKIFIWCEVFERYIPVTKTDIHYLIHTTDRDKHHMLDAVLSEDNNLLIG